jgi:hypothetical protein
MNLPEALERAATELSSDADSIRPANGDPIQLLESLDEAGAIRVLAWLLEHDLDAGEELALTWSEDDRGLAPLQNIDERSLPKSGRKILRKIMHRLRSGGIELEEKAPSAPVVSRLPEISEELDGAYATLVDSRGSYLIYLVERHPSSGARLFQVVLDELRGVLDFKVYSAGRSKLRRFLRDLTAGGAGTAVPAESDRVRALIGRIADGHPADRSLPRSFSEWRRKLLTGAADESPGSAAREALGSGSGEEGVAKVVARLEAGVLGPWPPAAGTLGVVEEKLESRLDKIGELTGSDREEEIEGALGEAGDALFTETHSIHTARRFEENAYVLWRSGREDEAVDCLAAASSLREEGGADGSIARAMTRLCYASLLERLTTKEEEAGSSQPGAES